MLTKITYLYQQLILAKLQSTFRKKRTVVVWRLSAISLWNLQNWYGLNTKHPKHLRNCQLLLKKLKRSVIDHLQSLEIEFQWYFPEQEEEDAFVRNPFSTSLAIANSLSEVQDKFFDLRNHSSAHDIFHKMPFLRFWWAVRESYPQRSELAFRILLSLPQYIFARLIFQL